MTVAESTRRSTGGVRGIRVVSYDFQQSNFVG